MSATREQAAYKVFSLFSTPSRCKDDDTPFISASGKVLRTRTCKMCPFETMLKSAFMYAGCRRLIPKFASEFELRYQTQMD